MQYEVGELRRHPSIAGYVITELSDAFWEPNGLLHLDRSDKVFGHRLSNLFGADTVFADLDHRDIWADEGLAAEVCVRLDAPAEAPLSVSWTLSGPGLASRHGTIQLTTPPEGTVMSQRLVVALPTLATATAANLELELAGIDGRPRARQGYRLVVAPPSVRRHDCRDRYRCQAGSKGPGSAIESCRSAISWVLLVTC